jgi:hypothetical protein
VSEEERSPELVASENGGATPRVVDEEGAGQPETPPAGEGEREDKPEEPDREALMAAACNVRPDAIDAVEHAGGIGTATNPQKFYCGERKELYVVKFAQNGHGDGRGIFTEQVVALLAALLEAPVPRVELVNVSQSLIDLLIRDKAAHHLTFDPAAGVHHGSRWADNHSDRQGMGDHFDSNRQRFGALDVLYQWAMCTGDQQCIYDNNPGHHVLSVDHTTFFAGGYSWSQATLTGEVANIEPDAVLGSINLQPEDRAPALSRLAMVTEADIVGAVARPPDAWGVSQEDRLALVDYLVTRRDAVLQHHQN